VDDVDLVDDVDSVDECGQHLCICRSLGPDGSGSRGQSRLSCWNRV